VGFAEEPSNAVVALGDCNSHNESREGKHQEEQRQRKEKSLRFVCDSAVVTLLLLLLQHRKCHLLAIGNVGFAN